MLPSAFLALAVYKDADLVHGGAVAAINETMFPPLPFHVARFSRI